MTMHLELSCINCSTLLVELEHFPLKLDEELVCKKCYNDLLKQLGMDPL